MANAKEEEKNRLINRWSNEEGYGSDIFDREDPRIRYSDLADESASYRPALLKAARIVYKLEKGHEPEIDKLDDQELIKWSIGYMRNSKELVSIQLFDIKNLRGSIPDWIRIGSKTTDEQATALRYLQDVYEKFDDSTIAQVLSAASDPSTYLMSAKSIKGVAMMEQASLELAGIAARRGAASTAFDKAVGGILKAGVDTTAFLGKNSAIPAVSARAAVGEALVTASVDSFARQQVAQRIGQQSEFDTGLMFQQAGLSAVFGLGMHGVGKAYKIIRPAGGVSPSTSATVIPEYKPNLYFRALDIMPEKRFLGGSFFERLRKMPYYSVAAVKYINPAIDYVDRSVLNNLETPIQQLQNLALKLQSGQTIDPAALTAIQRNLANIDQRIVQTKGDVNKVLLEITGDNTVDANGNRLHLSLQERLGSQNALTRSITPKQITALRKSTEWVNTQLGKLQQLTNIVRNANSASDLTPHAKKLLDTSDFILAGPTIRVKQQMPDRIPNVPENSLEKLGNAGPYGRIHKFLRRTFNTNDSLGEGPDNIPYRQFRKALSREIAEGGFIDPTERVLPVNIPDDHISNGERLYMEIETFWPNIGADGGSVDLQSQVPNLADKVFSCYLSGEYYEARYGMRHLGYAQGMTRGSHWNVKNWSGNVMPDIKAKLIEKYENHAGPLGLLQGDYTKDKHFTEFLNYLTKDAENINSTHNNSLSGERAANKDWAALTKPIRDARRMTQLDLLSAPFWIDNWIKPTARLSTRTRAYFTGADVTPGTGDRKGYLDIDRRWGWKEKGEKDKPGLINWYQRSPWWAKIGPRLATGGVFTVPGAITYGSLAGAGLVWDAARGNEISWDNRQDYTAYQLWQTAMIPGKTLGSGISGWWNEAWDTGDVFNQGGIKGLKTGFIHGAGDVWDTTLSGRTVAGFTIPAVNKDAQKKSGSKNEDETDVPIAAGDSDEEIEQKKLESAQKKVREKFLKIGADVVALNEKLSTQEWKKEDEQKFLSLKQDLKTWDEKMEKAKLGDYSHQLSARIHTILEGQLEQAYKGPTVEDRRTRALGQSFEQMQAESLDPYQKQLLAWRDKVVDLNNDVAENGWGNDDVKKKQAAALSDRAFADAALYMPTGPGSEYDYQELYKNVVFWQDRLKVSAEKNILPPFITNLPPAAPRIVDGKIVIQPAPTTQSAADAKRAKDFIGAPPTAEEKAEMDKAKAEADKAKAEEEKKKKEAEAEAERLRKQAAGGSPSGSDTNGTNDTAGESAKSHWQKAVEAAKKADESYKKVTDVGQKDSTIDNLARAVGHGAAAGGNAGLGFITKTFNRYDGSGRDFWTNVIGVVGGLATTGFLFSPLLDKMGIGKIWGLGFVLRVGLLYYSFLGIRKLAHETLPEVKASTPSTHVAQSAAKDGPAASGKLTNIISPEQEAAAAALAKKNAGQPVPSPTPSTTQPVTAGNKTPVVIDSHPHTGVGMPKRELPQSYDDYEEMQKGYNAPDPKGQNVVQTSMNNGQLHISNGLTYTDMMDKLRNGKGLPVDIRDTSQTVRFNAILHGEAGGDQLALNVDRNGRILTLGAPSMADQPTADMV